MDFAQFQIVDIVVVGLILFLAIKGLVNGFSRELFNFLGLIGGIAVAARFNEQVGQLVVEQKILPEVLIAYQKVIGFIVIFVVIWILFSLISSLVSRFTSTETSIISRAFGYIIGLIRYGFIFALIIFGLNNADFLKEKFSTYYEKSQLFQPMVELGQILLNKESNATIVSSTENNETISEAVAETNSSTPSIESNTSTESNSTH